MTTHGATSRLGRLRDAGVSIWLDTLSRELLETGGFRRLVRDCAVSGATSNPTIFAKAITGSDRYDEQLRTLAASDVDDRQELFFAMGRDDIRAAAGLLRPVYDDSAGRDGFVSFECTPDLADDTEATIAPAFDLWSRLGLPNVMIKVPATGAGIPAIEELTARGRVAIANAHRAYARCLERFGDPRWARSKRAERDRSDRSGPAPARRTRPTPTSSTSSG